MAWWRIPLKVLSIVCFLCLALIGAEAKKGKHKKKKHSTEQVHFQAREPYECVWDEQTWNVEACKIEEDDHHGHQRNEGHGGEEHHDLCPSQLIKLNRHPKCSKDEVLWHFCAHSCNCDTRLDTFPHAMVRKFECDKFKDILAQPGYPENNEIQKPEHIECDNYPHGMYVNCHCQPDDSKAAMLSLVIMGAAFLAFKLGAFFWVKYTTYKRRNNGEKGDNEEEKSLINGH